MRKLVMLSVLVLTLSSGVFAQAQHNTLVSWTETDPAVTSFNAYAGPTQTGTLTKLNSSGPIVGPQYTDSAVTAGVQKCYGITALDPVDGTESPMSSPIVCAVTPPFGVTGLKVSLNGTIANIGWNASADSTASYLVETGPTSGSTTTVVATVPSGSLSYSTAALAPGSHCYTVYATLGGAQSITYPTPICVAVFRASPSNVTLTAR